MNAEDLRAMMTNLRECSEGANDEPALDPRPDQVQCDGGCGHWILADNPTGLCYQCQAAMHVSGELDMDSEHPQICLRRRQL